MQKSTDAKSRPDQGKGPSLSTGFRSAAPAEVVLEQLNYLANLSGTWIGNGFSLISLPDRGSPHRFRLKLTPTKEIMTLRPIGAPIPNRGSAQEDISFLGLHYFQQVSDAVTNAALHLEPGLWLTIPATEAPRQGPTIVRLGTTPHGNSLLAQGPLPTKKINGKPDIGAVDALPFTLDPFTGARRDVSNYAYLKPFLTPELPHWIPRGSAVNPNLILRKDIQAQDIEETIELKVSATPIGGIAPLPASTAGAGGGITNIPFLIPNANAIAFAATFWIETVKNEDQSTRVQLQYSQTTILDFNGLKWPHITVATLVQQ